MIGVELGDVEIAGAFLVGFVMGVIVVVRLTHLAVRIVRHESEHDKP